MNISMLDLQDTLHTQLLPLSTVQHQTIQEHPAQGEALLRTLGVDDELWLKAVLYHHAAVDRSGHSLSKNTDEESPIAAELISLADVYYARTSTRANRPALGPTTVLKMLFLGEGSPLREGSAPQFIKALGIFPPGTAVRLRNRRNRRSHRTGQQTQCATGLRRNRLRGHATADTGDPRYTKAAVHRIQSARMVCGGQSTLHAIALGQGGRG